MASGHPRSTGEHTEPTTGRGDDLRPVLPHPRKPLLDTADLPDVLTRREREVALMAAAGRASREIADLLGLSVRTVDNYLGRAYSKLGVSGRTQLAGLLCPDGSGPAPGPDVVGSQGFSQAPATAGVNGRRTLRPRRSPDR